jgi:DNA-binding HxlR family transcriptional regulator
MYERKIPLAIDCGLHLTKEVLNGKWKPALLNAISMDIKRPSDMARLLPGATRRVLTVQLKELEEHGMVEYSLTEIGWSLMPIIDAMNQWGDTHRQFLETVIAQDPRTTQVSKSTCQVYRSMIVEEKTRE